VILICGRYEGVDERVAENLVTDEISIGDYILTGGEPAAVVIIDAISRFVPGVVGNEESVKQDSFVTGMFDHPHYTRPRDFDGLEVPEVLFSGDHGRIDAWRRRMALEKTWFQRPELLDKEELSERDEEILKEIRSERKGKNHEPD
jgi:tRNA (guanine37-N1)-methyltransferase